MWNELTFLWNELTILWNDLTIDWNDLTWNDLTMERNDRKSCKAIAKNHSFCKFHCRVDNPGHKCRQILSAAPNSRLFCPGQKL